jgi:hypothetical protein
MAADNRSPADTMVLDRQLVQQRELLAKKAGATTQSVTCWLNVWILANGNARYVSAEMGYPGGDYAMLRARSSSIGPWERFGVCRESVNGLTNIWSQHNGLAVSTELGYGGGDHAMLRARSSSIGSWEYFYTNSPGPGGQGAYTLFQSAANGKYVAAEVGYGGDDHGMLRARSASYDAWELFYWKGDQVQVA